ncbi:MAG: membrane dipeptidase [Chloroflexi bacterium]|nr:membrane dipeptidase [Chloroflexota bacterium]
MSSTEIADRLHQESIIIDGLNVSNWDSDAVFRDLQLGGVTAINATVATWENLRETLDHTTAWYRRLRERADATTLIETVDDIVAAKRSGKVGIILGWQNASPIENDLDRLDLFHRLGVRIVQVTYHERNLLGNGCYERVDDGLSNFGLDAVREMNRLGIVIDLSHVGERTTLETIDVSSQPVAVTHANVKSYHDMKRNKADEAVRKLAECIRSMMRGNLKGTLDDYLDSIDHLVQMVGVDHVAVGTDHTQDQPPEFWRYIASQQGTRFPSTFVSADTDYSKVDLYPDGLKTPAGFPNLTAALLERGYSEEDTAKIIGGNWLRLFREVWGR